VKFLRRVLHRRPLRIHKGIRNGGPRTRKKQVVVELILMIVDKAFWLATAGTSKHKSLFAFIAWSVLGFAVTGQAQNLVPDQINPPFGFQWGEAEKDIEKIITRAQARIVTRETVQGRDAWTIEGLIQPALKRTVLYFGTEKTLVEVELQYEHSDWDLPAYEEFLNSAKQRLEAKYGPPTVLARDKKPEGDVMQTVVGYQWQQSGSSIQLFFFSAERNSEVYRSISLHYRAG
jgi:hypothetical protein